jgi:hypothetical protein
MRRMGLLVGGRSRMSDPKRIWRSIGIALIIPMIGLCITGWSLFQHWMAQ